MRRDAHDAFTGGDQRLLEAPRHMAAVLDRPDAIVVRPRAQRSASRCPASFAAISGTRVAAGPVVDRRQRVRALVRVRSDHDHPHRPFVG